MRKIFFVIAVLAFIFISNAWAVDISGTWTITHTSPVNNQDDPFDLAIKADGENLTITGKHPELGDMAGTGTLKGNDIKMNINTGGGTLDFTFTGKVAGNKMSGTREITPRQSIEAGGAAVEAGGAGGEQAAAGGPPSGGQAPAVGQEAQGAPSDIDPATVSKAWTAVKK